MSFSSQSGQVVVKHYVGGDTFPADMATTGIGVRTRSGQLSANRELLVLDPEIGGSRDITDAYLGAVVYSGEYEMYMRFQELATFLKGGFGQGSSAVATGVNTHTITPADVLPWLAVQEKVGSGFDSFNYTDAKVNTFHLEAEANGYLMGTVGMLARKQTAGVTPATSVEYAALTDTAPLAVGTNISVTYNGVTLPAKSFSLDLNNNIEDDDFRLGSFYVGEFTAKQRELTMGVTIRPQDNALWREAVNGAAAAVTPGGLTSKQQTVITISAYEDIPLSAPLTKYSCTLTIPKSTIKPWNPEPSGDDVLEADLEIQAFRPSVATPLITAVVKNDKATII